MLIRPKLPISNISFYGIHLGSTKHCTEKDFHIYHTHNNLFGLQDLQQPEKWNKPESPAVCLLVSMRHIHTMYKEGAGFA